MVIFRRFAIMVAHEIGDRIFISYRRGDRDEARAICQVLANEFGDSRIFFDEYDIEGGRDFGREILSQLHRCSVVVVVIGRTWLDRIGDLYVDTDWIRRELAVALYDERKLVLPVLVDVAAPNAAQLPEEIRPLIERNHVVLTKAHWALHMPQIVGSIVSFGFLRYEARRAASLLGLATLATVLVIAALFVAVAPLEVPRSWTWLFATGAGVVALWTVGWAAGTFGTGKMRAVLSRLQFSRRIWKDLARVSIALSLLTLYTFRPIAVTREPLETTNPGCQDSNYYVEPAALPCDQLFAASPGQSRDEHYHAVRIRRGLVRRGAENIGVAIGLSTGSILGVRVPFDAELTKRTSASQIELRFPKTSVRSDFVVWVRADAAAATVVAGLTR